MRQANLSQNSWIALAVIALLGVLGFVTVQQALGFSLLASATDTGTTSSASGLEFYTANGLEELTMLGGCTSGQVVKRNSSNLWACASDATAEVSGAGVVEVDLDDDGIVETDLLATIATTGTDTNSVFTVPEAGKLLIDLDANWPAADAADASSTNPDDCAANQFATGINTTWDLTCAQPAFTDISGSVTDAQVPDTITIDNAATADALTANGTDCSAGQAAGGVDAAGNAEACVNVYSTIQGDGSSLTQRATLNLTGSGVSCSDTGSITQCDFSATGGSGYDTIEEEDSALTQRTTLNFEGASVTCADDTTQTTCTFTDANTNASTECAGTNTYLDGEANCDTLDGLEDFEAATDDGLPVGNGTGFDTRVLPDCQDSTGNHLNYNNTTNAFACGTSSSVTDTNAGTECAGDTTYLSGEGNCNDIDPVYANVLGDTFTGTVSVTGAAQFILNLDCSGFDNGGTLSVTGSGVVHCQNDDAGAGASNSFETIDAPLGDDPVASSATDTLTLQSTNSSVAITGSAAADSLDFAVLNSPAIAGTTITGAATDDSIILGSGVANGVWVGLPDCDDSGGNHINYDQTTNTFTCGTSTSGNAFTTWVPTAGDNIVADSAADTATLVSTNATIAITGTAASDTLDFDAIGVSCTGCIGTTEVAGLDISDDTNLTCGRSLTLSGDGCDADAELFTIKKSINITSPVTASHTNLVQFEYATAATITEISCSTDTGTMTIQFDERARATPNTAGTDVMTAALVCDSDSQTTTTFDNAGIAVDVPLNLQLTASTGTPGVVRIHLKATRDD